MDWSISYWFIKRNKNIGPRYHFLVQINAAAPTEFRICPLTPSPSCLLPPSALSHLHLLVSSPHLPSHTFTFLPRPTHLPSHTFTFLPRPTHLPSHTFAFLPRPTHLPFSLQMPWWSPQMISWPCIVVCCHWFCCCTITDPPLHTSCSKALTFISP